MRREGEGEGTTKGLVQAQVPYNCFYKSFSLPLPHSWCSPRGPGWGAIH